MVRVLVLIAQEPDPQRYEEHAELCRRVPGGTFRHGRVFGSPFGAPPHRYYAEWEFPDRETFEASARSEEFLATGRDARAMGLAEHMTIEFVELA